MILNQEFHKTLYFTGFTAHLLGLLHIAKKLINYVESLPLRIKQHTNCTIVI